LDFGEELLNPDKRELDSLEDTKIDELELEK
jgi:hypothetical protein